MRLCERRDGKEVKNRPVEWSVRCAGSILGFMAFRDHDSSQTTHSEPESIDRKANRTLCRCAKEFDLSIWQYVQLLIPILHGHSSRTHKTVQNSRKCCLSINKLQNGLSSACPFLSTITEKCDRQKVLGRVRNVGWTSTWSDCWTGRWSITKVEQSTLWCTINPMNDPFTLSTKKSISFSNPSTNRCSLFDQRGLSLVVRSTSWQ